MGGRACSNPRAGGGERVMTPRPDPKQETGRTVFARVILLVAGTARVTKREPGAACSGSQEDRRAAHQDDDRADGRAGECEPT